MTVVDSGSIPDSVRTDPVVVGIAKRANHVRLQMDRATDLAHKSRLQGQYDAYVADLIDAVRDTAKRHARRSGDHVISVNKAVVEGLIG